MTSPVPPLRARALPRARTGRPPGLVAAAVLLALVAVSLAGCASSGASTAPGIKVTKAMVPAPPSTDVAAAYFTLTNTSSRPDVLESAASDASKQAIVHRTVTKGGIESMVPAGPVTIGGGKSFVLSPGGYHLMLMGLTRSLKVGDTVQVTLRFKRAGTLRLEVPVVAPDAVLPGNSAMPTMSMSAHQGTGSAP